MSEPTREQWILGKQMQATAASASSLYEAADGEKEAVNEPGFVENVCDVINENISAWQLENTIAIYQKALDRKRANG